MKFNQIDTEILNEQLKKSTIDLSLDLSCIFEFSGEIAAKAYPLANKMEDNSIKFKAVIEEDTRSEVVQLIKSKELNRKKLRSLRGYYHYVFEKKPESLEVILDRFDTEEALFNYIVGLSYDIRYYSDNILTTSVIYSGEFRNQGLMTRFYQSLAANLDFKDLEYVEFQDIVENRTVNMFNRLRKKIPNDHRLCELMKRKYVKSPFMKLLNKLGFKDMQIYTECIYIGDLRGRKSNHLNFSLHQCE